MVLNVQYGQQQASPFHRHLSSLSVVQSLSSTNVPDSHISPSQIADALGSMIAELKVELERPLLSDTEKYIFWSSVICILAGAVAISALLYFPRKRSGQPADYRYSPLDAERNEIRLLRILPSRHDDEMLRCELRHASLSKHPSYAALSYHWGDHSDQRLIELNGCPMQITRTLEEALRQMRPRWSSTEIWVDALCINQVSKSERAAQVLHMFAIYQEAQVVAVWVGPASHNSNLVMAMLSKKQGGNTSFAQGTHTTRPADVTNEPPSADDLDAFLSRHYWRRVWVIQEISAAREICVLCGDWTIELRDIELFLQDLMIANSIGTLPTKALAIKQIFDIRNARREQKPIKLLDALQRTSDCSSTEPLDKIYGLLGVVRDKATFVTVPDYSLTPQQLCIIMTKNAIFETAFLDIIFLGGKRSLAQGLPSWCPDYFAAAGWDVGYRQYVAGNTRIEQSGRVGPRWNTTGNTRVSSTTTTIEPASGIMQTKGLILTWIHATDEPVKVKPWRLMRRVSDQDRYFGFADPDTEIGDAVALLHGCTIPVVLRPVVGQENRFHFVGMIRVVDARNDEHSKRLANDAHYLELS